MYRTVLVRIDDTDSDRDVMAVADALAGGCERLITVDAAEDLLRVAQESSADLTVVGQGRSSSASGRGDDRASVTLHRAPCTVAVAPLGYADRAQAIERVGVAYDGSPQSRTALDHARALAACNHAKLAACKIVQLADDPGARPWHLLDAPDRIVDATRSELADSEIDDLSVLAGPVRPSLLAFSDGTDVMFCGSRQYGPLQLVALGSTGNYLAHHCRCPLLITPAVAEHPWAAAGAHPPGPAGARVVPRSELAPHHRRRAAIVPRALWAQPS